MEDFANIGEVDVDTSAVEVEKVEVPKVDRTSKGKKVVTPSVVEDEPLINCLRNEKVIVRCILKPSGNIDKPNHALYGGMAETAVKVYTLPLLKSGSYKNALTKAEKRFLEKAMGLEDNALSIYLKDNNYWESDNATVRLTKSDTRLDLSNPEEYIKYKILLANSETIAPSIEEMKSHPKETYRYVLIREGEEIKTINNEMNAAMQASFELGKVLNNKPVLRMVVETLTGKPVSENSTESWLQAQAFKEMQANPKTFISILQDPYLDTKVMIKEAIVYGLIKKRGDLYFKADNTPLADGLEDPTFTNAARYINAVKNQEYKLMLEAKIKASKK
jgi:hypothetical protein|nr:MAG TPA: hypothetical protein [Crassvirales sp.]